MRLIKLSNKIEPKIVVINTITKTHPYIISLFAVFIVIQSANAITPLIKPEYQTTNNS